MVGQPSREEVDLAAVLGGYSVVKGYGTLSENGHDSHLHCL